MKNSIFTIVTIAMFVTLVEFINEPSVEHTWHFCATFIASFALGLRKGGPLRDNLFTEE